MKKKYKGKLTVSILTEIREKVMEEKVKNPRKKFYEEVYQSLCSDSPVFQERMKIANTPELEGYISLTDYVSIKGIDENGNESWVGICLEKYFASHKENLKLINQEWFDQIKKFDTERQKIRRFFDSKLRIFLSRSLNVFFETFPELEKFYIYVNPLERNKAGRELMAPEQIENMKKTLNEIL